MNPLEQHKHYMEQTRKARNAVGFLMGIFLALIVGSMLGCAVPVASTGITQQHSQDLNRQDDEVEEYCQTLAIGTVAINVQNALGEGVQPEEITEDMIVEAMGIVYNRCMQTHGRRT